MTSLIAADGSGRSANIIPAAPAAWSVTTIALIEIRTSASFLSGRARRVGVGRLGLRIHQRPAGLGGATARVNSPPLMHHAREATGPARLPWGGCAARRAPLPSREGD